MDRLRLGWLAPEDCTLPPGDDSGSITNVIWQLAQRLSACCDLVIAARDRPGGENSLGSDGAVRFVRHGAAVDVRRGAALDVVNKVQRKLRLPDLPYAGRDSYYRGYARAHAANLREAGVDLVHLHNTSQWVPFLRAALPQSPIVLQMHCEWLAEIPHDVGLARLRQVDRVLAVSEQVADQVRARYPERADAVRVLHNGVDAGVFRPVAEVRATRGDELAELGRRLGIGDGPTILFVGRISAEKGLHVLLDALPAIAARVPDVQVVLVGPGFGLRSPLPTRQRRELLGHPEWRTRYIDHLRELAAGLDGRVHFTGPVRSSLLPLVYALADVYVQPSVFEAFGLPVLEAMTAELPVVAAAGGALPELVSDGVNGHVVPVGEAASLAEAVSSVLEDPARAERLGRAGRARAVADFSWDVVGERLLDIYSELTGGGVRHRVEAMPDTDRRAVAT